MERAISVEEKIRRAEEIYERRKLGVERPNAIVSLNNEKKDLKLLKKMFIQVMICILIYFAIYVIYNNEYVFSKDFIEKVNEILEYDTNFGELYENVKSKIQILVPTNKETIQENTPNAEGTNTEAEQSNIEEDAIGGANEEIAEAPEPVKELTQAEQDIINVKNTTTFIKPVDGVISSKFGQRDTATGRVPKNHTGTDIAANMGTKIKSATDGEVVLYSEEGDYGKHLKIQIGEVSIIYAHCNALYVKQGDKVVQGQEIAEVGSTGNSTGPHLHFEIRISERTVDPQSILEL